MVYTLPTASTFCLPPPSSSSFKAYCIIPFLPSLGPDASLSLDEGSSAGAHGVLVVSRGLGRRRGWVGGLGGGEGEGEGGGACLLAGLGWFLSVIVWGGDV